MPSIKSNVKALKDLARSYDKMNALMNEAVTLYETRRIPRRETAEKMIKQLARKKTLMLNLYD